MQILQKIDYAFTVIFCLEATLKIVAHGFIKNGSTSYLSSYWNVLDFVIVIVSLVSTTVDSQWSVVKVLRVARILRPLRLIQHADGLKVAIHALLKAIPQIVRL